MTVVPSHPSGSALRERMIEDMSLRGFTETTRHDYIRCVKAFAAFIGRSPDTATPEDLRRFGDRSRNAGGAEFANAASAGRACMHVEFVDEMHLNVGWNIRVHGQGNARRVLRQPAPGPHTTKPVRTRACRALVARSDPKRFVILLTTKQLWRSIPAGRDPSRTAGSTRLCTTAGG